MVPSRRLRVGLLLEVRTLLAGERAMLERIVHSDYADIVLIVRSTPKPDIDAVDRRHKIESPLLRAVRRTACALQAILDAKVGGCIPYAFDAASDLPQLQ